MNRAAARAEGIGPEMKTTRIAMLLGGVSLIAAAAVAAGTAPRVSAAPAQGAQAARVGNFLLVDQNLVAHELYRLADAPAIAIISQQNGDAAIRDAAPQVN